MDINYQWEVEIGQVPLEAITAAVLRAIRLQPVEEVKERAALLCGLVGKDRVHEGLSVGVSGQHEVLPSVCFPE